MRVNFPISWLLNLFLKNFKTIWMLLVGCRLSMVHLATTASLHLMAEMVEWKLSWRLSSFLGS